MSCVVLEQDKVIDHIDYYHVASFLGWLLDSKLSSNK